MRRATSLALAGLAAAALAACGGSGPSAQPSDFPTAKVTPDPDEKGTRELAVSDVVKAPPELIGQRVSVRGRFLRGGVEPAPAFAMTSGGERLVVVLPESLEGIATEFREDDRIVATGVVERLTDELDESRDFVPEPRNFDGPPGNQLVVLGTGVRAAR